jgi:hypothetical protein
VRNCYIEGFLNNIRITREGFQELAEWVEYDNAYSDIVIEDSTSLNSRGVGIFVDGYVTGVTLRNLHVEGAGSAGIYLEAGSKDNVVESKIVNNGTGKRPVGARRPRRQRSRGWAARGRDDGPAAIQRTSYRQPPGIFLTRTAASS